MRAEGAQDVRCANDPAQAERADDQEPEQHHRPEDVADECCSLPLHEEQANQDGNADWNDEGRELGCVELQTLNGA